MNNLSTAAPTTSVRKDSSDQAIGTQLLADLVEVQSYYRERRLTGQDLSDAELHFIVGLVRYLFASPDGPILERRAHIMVIGGAGAGKSTTANIVVGASVAEANAQAGYTRHPTAIYRPIQGESHADWPDHLGPLKRLDRVEAGNLDEDRYDISSVTGETLDPNFLTHHVVWDCPDLTAKDASYYEARVIEIASLADVCLYVASDERYNDELPTNFLQALLEAGKPTIVTLTKMSPYDAEELAHLFREQVLSRLKNAELVKDVYPIPMPLQVKAHELWTKAFPHGNRLREMIDQVTGDLARLRKSARQHATQYLSTRRGRLLDPLAKDVGEWRLWVEQVRRASNTAVQRYEREYLSRSVFDDFQDARDAILAALPIPGRYAYAWELLEYLRVPYRMIKSAASKYVDRKTTGSVDEAFLLDRIREQLVDSLIVTVSGRRSRGGFWGELHRSLSNPKQLRMDAVYDDVRTKQLRDLRTHQRDAYERIDVRLNRSPSLLWGLRVGRLAIDAVAIGLGVWLGYQLFGTSLWIIALVLLSLGLADDLVRILCGEYVRREREELIAKQRENARELFRIAYLDEMSNLPTGLGNRLHRMSEILDRIPKSISALAQRSTAEERE